MTLTMTPLDANRTPKNKPFTSDSLFLTTPEDTTDTLRVLDLHVCRRLDPMETIGTREECGYGHLELVGTASSGDILAAAGSGKRWN